MSLEPLGIGTVLEDRYRVDTFIAQGGMGEVYKATRIKLGGVVAIKRLLMKAANAQQAAKLREQFTREARILANLTHPNLVRVLDFFEDGETMYLVMEYVAGETLDDAGIRAAQPEKAVLFWADKLLSALEYVHAQSPPIIVRDLKPANVLITPTGEVKLIDFGLAKEFERNSVTRTAIQGRGSKGYAAIEQYGGGTDVQTDLYALGATMLFLLTGKDPPEATNRVTKAAELQDPRLVNQVSDATWQAIQTLMAIDATQRPASARAARLLLPAWSEGINPPSGKLVEPPRPQPAMGTPPPTPDADKTADGGWVKNLFRRFIDKRPPS